MPHPRIETTFENESVSTLTVRPINSVIGEIEIDVRTSLDDYVEATVFYVDPEDLIEAIHKATGKDKE